MPGARSVATTRAPAAIAARDATPVPAPTSHTNRPASDTGDAATNTSARCAYTRLGPAAHAAEPTEYAVATESGARSVTPRWCHATAGDHPDVDAHSNVGGVFPPPAIVSVQPLPSSTLGRLGSMCTSPEITNTGGIGSVICDHCVGYSPVFEKNAVDDVTAASFDAKHACVLAFSVNPAMPTSATPERMPTTAIAMMSSIRLKPERSRRFRRTVITTHFALMDPVRGRSKRCPRARPIHRDEYAATIDALPVAVHLHAERRGATRTRRGDVTAACGRARLLRPRPGAAHEEPHNVEA